MAGTGGIPAAGSISPVWWGAAIAYVMVPVSIPVQACCVWVNFVHHELYFGFRHFIGGNSERCGVLRNPDDNVTVERGLPKYTPVCVIMLGGAIYGARGNIRVIPWVPEKYVQQSCC